MTGNTSDQVVENAHFPGVNGPSGAGPQARDGVISARDVTIKFGTFTAVHQASLTVGAGEVFGLLGPNGSGKTTLIRSMCGLIPLAGGEARILGRNVKKHAEEIRAVTGYMSQKFSLYEDLTTQENMDFYCGIYGLTPAQTKERQAELTAK